MLKWSEIKNQTQGDQPEGHQIDKPIAGPSHHRNNQLKEFNPCHLCIFVSPNMYFIATYKENKKWITIQRLSFRKIREGNLAK